MRASSYIAVRLSIRPIILRLTITVPECLYWKSFRNRIFEAVKRRVHTWKNCVLLFNIWKYPTAVLKKAVCVVMRIYPYALSVKKSSGLRRKSRISIPLRVYKRVLNMKPFGRLRFWKKAVRLFRKPADGTKIRVSLSVNV